MNELEAFLSGSTLLSGFSPVLQLGCGVNIALNVWKTKYISVSEKLQVIESTFESKLTQLELDIEDIRKAGLLTGFGFIKFIVKLFNYLFGVGGKYLALFMIVFSGFALVFSSFNNALSISNTWLLILSFSVLLLPLLMYYLFIGFSMLSETGYSKYCDNRINSFQKMKDVFTKKTPKTPTPPDDI